MLFLLKIMRQIQFFFIRRRFVCIFELNWFNANQWKYNTRNQMIKTHPNYKALFLVSLELKIMRMDSSENTSFVRKRVTSLARRREMIPPQVNSPTTSYHCLRWWDDFLLFISVPSSIPLPLKTLAQSALFSMNGMKQNLLQNLKGVMTEPLYMECLQ